MSRKLTQEQIIRQFKKAHGNRYDYSKVKYIHGNTKVEIICPIHGSFWQTPNGHKIGKGCKRCAVDNKNALLTQDEVIKQFRKVHGNKYDYSKVIYKRADIEVEIICPTHGSFLQIPNCSSKKFHISDSVNKARPDLVKYFADKKDSLEYTPHSNKKIKLKCPDCGYKKNIVLNNLSNRGFICPICGDGISIPEKFMANLLKELNISFEIQYMPKWSQNKRYDFYLPDYNIIIETHGGQHYKNTGRGRSLEKEQKNDRFKKKIALDNKINKYIIVDCRCTTIEWLKGNCIKELSPYLGLNEIDWEHIWIESQKSLVKKVCSLWDNKKQNEGTLDMANIFGLSRSTIIKYLKIGNKIGWCSYIPNKK